MQLTPASLISYENFVQSPFIIVKIGNYTFGDCAKKGSGKSYKIDYPNFMKSIKITKINGKLNQYSLVMEYGITQFDDPNLLDAVFSSVSDTRKITITYGDWNMPSYIYKEEEALITKVKSDVQFSTSKITYTVECTSSALMLTSSSYSFPAWTNTKGSDVVKNLLSNAAYGLTEVFTGMTKKSVVESANLIQSDDKPVNIPAKHSTSIIDYITYICGYMTSYTDIGTELKDTVYTWTVVDDIYNNYGGPYFKIGSKTSNLVTNKSGDVFELDIGYPGPNHVTEFKLSSDDSWAILYKFSKDINLPQYGYEIDNNGRMVTVQSPSILGSGKYSGVTEADRSWWTDMTKFPVQATLTIKGLLRPAILMSYIKINTYFYGHKHVSSGTYFITKQEDSFSSSGYSTTLSLTRMSID